MKKNILLIVLSVIGLVLTAQIEISEYERAFKVDANNVPAPNVEFTSSCGKVNVEISEKMASGGCIGNLIRSYTATDDCGNTAKAEQYLSLQDNEGPEIYGVPEDIKCTTDQVPNAAIVGAKDLGDKTIKVTMSETKKGNKLIRTWSAKDQCGNESSASQVITLEEISARSN